GAAGVPAQELEVVGEVLGGKVELIGDVERVVVADGLAAAQWAILGEDAAVDFKVCGGRALDELLGDGVFQAQFARGGQFHVLRLQQVQYAGYAVLAHAHDDGAARD